MFEIRRIFGSSYPRRIDDETKSGPQESFPEKLIRDIRRKIRRHWSVEEKIRIVQEGQRGERSIAELYRREGIAESQYYSWSNVVR